MGRDGKPKPKNTDKVGFRTSGGGGGDKNKSANGTRHNNNNEGAGVKLIQNPLFIGKGRSTIYSSLIVHKRFHIQFPVCPKEESLLSNSALMPPPPPPKVEKKEESPPVKEESKEPHKSPMASTSGGNVKDFGRNDETIFKE